MDQKINTKIQSSPCRQINFDQQRKSESIDSIFSDENDSNFSDDPEKTELPHDSSDHLPLGEAQLIDPTFKLCNIPNGQPIVRANWSKLKAYILTMLHRNQKERPNISEAAKVLKGLVDVRIVETKYKMPFPK